MFSAKKISVCNQAKVKKKDLYLLKQIQHFGGERNRIKNGRLGVRECSICHGTNRLGPSILKHNTRNQVQHHRPIKIKISQWFGHRGLIKACQKSSDTFLGNMQASVIVLVGLRWR